MYGSEKVKVRFHDAVSIILFHVSERRTATVHI